MAVVPFTVVVNPRVRPDPRDREPLDLTLGQLRKIFDGNQKSWRDNDPRLADIPIRIIGRGGDSGSRAAFERYVLGDGSRSRSQGLLTSSDCVNRNDSTSSATTLCEKGTTTSLLDRVAEVPGAIGYADLADALRAEGVVPVRIDGRAAMPDDLREGYPFWTVEYVYRRADLPSDSLPVAFVNYLLADAQLAALAADGHLPCRTVPEICAQR